MLLLVDRIFDPAGTEYATAVYTLRKTTGPALAPDSIGPVDAVLLSHDHHADNLDRAGPSWLPHARHVTDAPSVPPAIWVSGDPRLSTRRHRSAAPRRLGALLGGGATRSSTHSRTPDCRIGWSGSTLGGLL